MNFDFEIRRVDCILASRLGLSCGGMKTVQADLGSSLLLILRIIMVLS